MRTRVICRVGQGWRIRTRPAAACRYGRARGRNTARVVGGSERRAHERSSASYFTRRPACWEILFAVSSAGGLLRGWRAWRLLTMRSLPGRTSWDLINGAPASSSRSPSPPAGPELGAGQITVAFGLASLHWYEQPSTSRCILRL
jgi:hypothetical protein